MDPLDLGTVTDDNKGPEIESGIHEARKPQPARKLAGFTLIDPIDAEFTRHAADERTDDSGNAEPGASLGSGATEPRKRRGRPLGSVNGIRTAESKTVPASIEQLETLLFSIHLMGANLIGQPTLALDKTESRQLSDAIKEVMKHYPIGLDPKKMAIANLMACGAGIYGPRVVAIIQSRPPSEPKPERAAPPKVQPIREEPKAAKIENPSQLWNEAPINANNDW